jgi:hypothetical protein
MTTRGPLSLRRNAEAIIEINPKDAKRLKFLAAHFAKTQKKGRTEDAKL